MLGGVSLFGGRCVGGSVCDGLGSYMNSLRLWASVRWVGSCRRCHVRVLLCTVASLLGTITQIQHCIPYFYFNDKVVSATFFCVGSSPLIRSAACYSPPCLLGGRLSPAKAIALTIIALHSTRSNP